VLFSIEDSSYENILWKYILSKYNMTTSTTKRENVEGLIIKGLDVSGKKVPN
jgi:hypothetical protein